MTNHLVRAAVCLAVAAVTILIIGLLLPEQDVRASASNGTEQIILATGFVDDQAEALFYLDAATGELKAAVIDPRLGRFNAFYSRNIAGDFPGVPNPRFAMVTGLADLPRGNISYGRCVLYVAEQTSGQVGVYVIPWSNVLANFNARQTAPIILLDRTRFRTTYIRP